MPPAFGIRSYPLAGRWEWIWIWTGDLAGADETLLPDHQAIALGVAGHQSIAMAPYYVDGRYQLMNDNLLDLSHLAYLHSTKIGMEEVATTRDDVEIGETTVRSIRRVTDAPASPSTRGRHGDIRVDFLLDFTFYAPALHVGINRTWIAAEEFGSGELIQDTTVYHAVTLATPHTTHYFFARTVHPPLAEADPDAISVLIDRVIQHDLFAAQAIERMLRRKTEVRDMMTAEM